MNLSSNKNFLTFLILFIIIFTSIAVYFINKEQRESMTQKQALDKIESLENSINKNVFNNKSIKKRYTEKINAIKSAIKGREKVDKIDLNKEIEKIKEIIKDK